MAHDAWMWTQLTMTDRQAKEEPWQGDPRYGQGEGWRQGQEEINVCACTVGWLWMVHTACGIVLWPSCLHDLARTRYQPGVSCYGCNSIVKITSSHHLLMLVIPLTTRSFGVGVSGSGDVVFCMLMWCRRPPLSHLRPTYPHPQKPASASGNDVLVA